MRPPAEKQVTLDEFSRAALRCRLLHEIRDPRQPPLRRQAVNRGEELLQALEALLALDRDQRVAMAMTRPLPTSGHDGRIDRDVLLVQQVEPRRVDEV